MSRMFLGCSNLIELNISIFKEYFLLVII